MDRELTREHAASRPPGHPIVPLLLLIAATTGLVDAVSVLGLGFVFCANMTGNIVFLGFAVAGTPGFDIAPHITALAGFAVGAIISGRVGKHHATRSRRRWLLTAACFEGGLLWLAALLVIGYRSMHQPVGALLFITIGFVAVAMGFRNGTIRQLKVNDLTTTVLTMTLTGLFVDSHFAGGTNPNWQRRALSVAAIFGGASLGALMVRETGLSGPLFLAGLLVTVGTILAALHPAWAYERSAAG
ncbi:MAG TPA: YoaK family protein [Aliidongia sp.]|nr:YoaK family protein [Aliidongia sp.]